VTGESKGHAAKRGEAPMQAIPEGDSLNLVLVIWNFLKLVLFFVLDFGHLNFNIV